MIEARAGELFFAYEGWNEESQTEYRDMTAAEKVHRLRGQTGYIADDVPGLTIGAHYDKLQGPRPKFNGTTQAPITLLVSPRPYIGLTEQMIKQCRKVDDVRKDGCRRRCFWEGLDDDWQNFTPWHVGGLDGILDKVIDIYLNNSDVLTFFGTARRMVLQDKQEASLVRSAQEDEEDDDLAE